MRLASTGRIRPTALMLVVLAHVPLLLLFMWGWRLSHDEAEQRLVFLSIWPQVSKPVPADDSRAPDSPKPVAPPRAANHAPVKPAPSAPEEPTAAITVPAEPSVTTDAPRPSIDWRAEGAAAAARQAAPAASNTFTAAPKPLRKPCEKQKSTWEWNKQPKKAGITSLENGLPLPYVVLGRCVVGLGFFGCSPQKPPEANSHLLDDMHNGKTSPSSVPDMDRCD